MAPANAESIIVTIIINNVMSNKNSIRTWQMLYKTR